MGLFDKKYCDICGEKIGLLGNRKLEDGNMCKNCAAKLSSMIEGDDAVTACKINFLTERVTVESELSEDAVLALVRDHAKKFSSKVTIE